MDERPEAERSWMDEADRMGDKVIDGSPVPPLGKVYLS